MLIPTLAVLALLSASPSPAAQSAPLKSPPPTAAAPRSQPALAPAAVAPAQAASPAAEQQTRPSLAPLIERVRSTVVGVTARSEGRPSQGGAEEFWRRFFGDEFGGGPMRPPDGGGGTGLGSGVIIDPKGVVLTNNHVVEGAQEVLVRTADEKEYKARVVGTDPATDIALLRLDGVDRPLQAATLGASDSLRVGDYVVAIGNPFGLELTVTSGIISAKARVIGAGPYDDFLQTDAAINPGNSGGPLFDLEGRVVGINTAITATGQGIGFAVPIDLAKALLPQLEKSGRVVRGFLGIGVQDLTPELAAAVGVKAREGALVSSVEPGGPADKAGLKPGDVVVSLQGQKVEGASELSRRVAMLAPGTQTSLRVVRGGQTREVRALLGERPAQRGERRPAPPKKQGALGLALQPVPPEMARELGVQQGALVAEVEPGSRAAKAGLQMGDVIVEANRKPVRTPEDLIAIARQQAKGSLLLRVMREGGALFLVIPAG